MTAQDAQPDQDAVDLAERARQAVAKMPPPTDEQLRKLRPIWPPRQDSGALAVPSTT